MQNSTKSQAQKFVDAYARDKELACFILGNFLDDVDFETGDDFAILIFEDASRAGYIRALNDRNGQAWILGAGEIPAS